MAVTVEEPAVTPVTRPLDDTVMLVLPRLHETDVPVAVDGDMVAVNWTDWPVSIDADVGDTVMPVAATYRVIERLDVLTGSWTDAHVMVDVPDVVATSKRAVVGVN